MMKTILQYQKAFNSVVDRIKIDESVLSVMVFGSMVTGDLWEESDIDIFVIVREKFSEIRDIYAQEKGVPIHIKLMGKEKFIQLYSDNLKGGYIHRIFSSSRLIFSKDMDITVRYDGGRFFPDVDRERWGMCFLGKLLKDIGVCKKYLSSDGVYTAYSTAIRCIEKYSRLFVNSSGYMISKDVMTMALNLNEDFKLCVDKLFFEKSNTVETIQETMTFLEQSINSSIKSNCSLLLNYMREKDKFLSAEEIMTEDLFKDFDIEMEELLNKLWERNIIKKEIRDFKINKDKILFNQNVYFV
ncbi:nucleotidyltransferase domain-containing protein [Clostridium sp. CM028]|uniref:nucleotidyltransferase domain-containing protein n=1 Tax=unclassified Clostridium TaxID=2614128 RepID=UPI001C0D5E8D|nr:MULTISPECIES: nucleotidyltransferase domain-containing protein [unclassified Clostridium]MBU3091873.1 nucleotidyltransferase domain-containing protein [Clostridium sp. CF011]MBW9147722.1 nucleotidyltransferase domain-containing protein [Clostridium sp. CM028]WAG70390.1 nucleotidyltransferase domain-containing protein [Clostridium sp. CF011]WLC62045.1 nucleotidyltransferase domain-containing protein [Clostridium sp. CM028]